MNTTKGNLALRWLAALALLAGAAAGLAGFSPVRAQGAPGGSPPGGAAALDASLLSINPLSAAAGGGAFTLTASGTEFAAGSVVRFNGIDLTTTFISDTQLSAQVGASLIATPGTVPVTVFTPGSGETGSVSFAVEYPVPAISSLDLTFAYVGGASFTLSITGTGFTPQTVAQSDHGARAITYVSSTLVTVPVAWNELGAPGTILFWLVNPAPGGGRSADATFSIIMPPPAGPFSKLAPADGSQWNPSTVTLSWEPSAYAGWYEYCVDDVPGTDCDTSWVYNAQQTSAVVTGLTPGQTYYWQVRAVNATEMNSGNGRLNWWSFRAAPNCPLTWDASITAADAGTGSQVVTVGMSPAGTDGLDGLCGEAQVPPLPPAGVFDARLPLPGGSHQSLIDIRGDAQQASYTLLFQPGAGGYPFTFTWDLADLPPGRMTLKDALTGTLVNVDMKAQSSYTLNNPGITSLLVEYSQFACVSITASAGWNLLSAPVTAADMRLSALFPGASAPAYRYAGGYQAVGLNDSLQLGRGYWVYFAAPSTANVCGVPAAVRDVAAGAGWSLVGTFDTATPVANITSTPVGIIVPPVYGYQGGYALASTLQPGRAYWLFTSAAGTLHYGAGGAGGSGMGASATAGFRLPLKLSGPDGSVTVEIGAGQAEAWLAPPVVPAGAFDARLARAGQDFLKDIRPAGTGMQAFVLAFTPPAAGQPVTITWDPSALEGYGRLVMVDRLTGNLARVDMASQGRVEVAAGSPLAGGVVIRYEPARYQVFAPFAVK